MPGLLDSWSAELERGWARARFTWPGVECPLDRFVAFVQERLGGADPGREALRLEDLYLVCATTHGDRAALGVFERVHFPQLVERLRRLGLSEAEREEVIQALRVNLFVSLDGRPPRILTYSGRGKLTSWLGTTAVRSWLNMSRARKGEVELEDATLEVLQASTDPHLELLRSRYARQFNLAFRVALRTLSPAERNVIRLCVLEGIELEKVGRMYNAHKSTVSRWLSRACATLKVETSLLLSRSLGLPPEESDSLLRALWSQTSVSVRRYLLPDEPTEARF